MPRLKKGGVGLSAISVRWLHSLPTVVHFATLRFLLLSLTRKTQLSIHFLNYCFTNESITTHKEAITPHKASITPHKEAITPHKASITPHKGGITPHKEAIIAHKGVIIAHKGVISPHKGVIIAHKGVIVSKCADSHLLKISAFKNKTVHLRFTRS